MCEVKTGVFMSILAWKSFKLRGEKIMAGTKIGGQKAAAKNLAKDALFYAKIGAKGGKNGHTGGFAANPALAREAGRIGGMISRRKKATVKTEA
jgi:general stress protein YciG